MTYRIRPVEIRDVAACQAIVRENWNDELAAIRSRGEPRLGNGHG
jgi:hypothetical protein